MQNNDGLGGLAVQIVSVEIDTTHRLFHIVFSKNTTSKPQRRTKEQGKEEKSSPEGRASYVY